MSRQRLLRAPVALALFGLASLVFIAALAPGRAAADVCLDTFGCIWGQPNYGGDEVFIPNGDGGMGWLPLAYNFNSAKNRYSARKLKLGRHSDSGPVEIACLDPGENRPDPGWFDKIFVSDVTNDSCPSP
jgi:hypothetical protein